MKRREWSLVIALILINYIVFNTFFNLAYQRRQPKPTPTRTPYPTFTPDWAGTATRVAAIPPTAVPDTPTSSPSPAPTDTVAPSPTATIAKPTATVAKRLTGAKPTIRATGVITHVLQPKETLYQVAVQYGVNVADLLAANDLSTPRDISVGLVLTVPLSSRARPTTTPKPTRTAVPTVTPALKTHTVQSGETLSQIARQYNVTTAAIVEASALENPNVLAVGQVLTIPLEVMSNE